MSGFKKAFIFAVLAAVAVTALLLSRKTPVNTNTEPAVKLDHLPLSLGVVCEGDDRFHVVVEECGEVVAAPFQVSRITRVRFDPEPADSAMAVKLKRYFEAGDFYISMNPLVYDVTRRQQRSADPSVDDYFVTNQRLLKAAKLDQDSNGEPKYNYVEAIKGSVRFENVNGVLCMLISRHSPIRTGPRLQSRGTDGEGNASMTVETELVIATNEQVVSYTVVRGSIPFRWSQQRSWLKPIPTPQFSTDAQENAQMIEKHLSILRRIYGSPIIGVSLVSFTGEERPIGEMYAEAAALVKDYPLHRFNYHHAVSEHKQEWGRVLVEPMRQQLEQIGFHSTVSASRQEGIVRVNCLTVLDRTSVGQSQIMIYMLERLLDDLHITKPDTRDGIRDWLKSAWVDTANTVSLQVGGTLAQQSAVIRYGEKTFRGNIDDAIVSLGRHWSSNKLHDGLFEVMKVAHGCSD